MTGLLTKGISKKGLCRDKESSFPRIRIHMRVDLRITNSLERGFYPARMGQSMKESLKMGSCMEKASILLAMVVCSVGIGNTIMLMGNVNTNARMEVFMKGFTVREEDVRKEKALRYILIKLDMKGASWMARGPVKGH